MDRKVLIEALEQLAPPSYAMEWDNPGLLIGSPEGEVRKVYLALDARSAAIDRAGQAGCDLMITHHPLLFRPVKSVRSDDFIGRRIISFIRNDMSCYAMHTNFDVAVMADIVAQKMGISKDRPLEITGEEDGRDIGIGFVGNLPVPMTLAGLAELIRERFGLQDVRCFGRPDAICSRAACCPGSGGGMADEAAAAGAQVFITGDVDHHYGIDCNEKGLCVLDAGHYGLEHIFTDWMQQWFADHFPEIEVLTDRDEAPFYDIQGAEDGRKYST